MGPALLLKSAARRHFSLLVFGVSQVSIDLEPLVRIVRGDHVLHGFTHTLAGALVVGAGAAVVARPAANWFLTLVRREHSEAWAAALLDGDISWAVAFASAWIGTGSHLLLDGIMHADMHPFAPLTGTNPLLGLVGLGPLHVFCIVSGAVGVALLIVYGALVARQVGSPPA